MKKLDLIRIINESFGHLDDKQIMALTIYGEARGESRVGKIAVGSVILERVKKQGWMGKDIKDVCLKPFQFSCYLPADPNFSSLKTIAADWQSAAHKFPPISDCYEIAAGLIDGSVLPNLTIEEKEATHYKTLNCKATWEATMQKVLTLGHHDFFAEV